MELTPILILELIIIGAIVVYQFKVAAALHLDIRSFSNFIPGKDYFEIEEVYVDKATLKKGNLVEIEDYINENFYEGDTERKRLAKEISILLINPRTNSGTYFDKIIESLNIYLFKNNGGIADFNIVKDLVERNVSVEEEQIKESINKPLYLGLMATLIGIIIGLGSLFFKIKVSDPGAALELGDFLVAVCIAMISSCIGLGITTFVGLNSFKNSKRQMELRKNDFYNFIQTELLPAISQDFGSSINRLTQSMQSFNNDFTTNVSSLSDLFQRNYETLKVQDTILDRLEKINAKDFMELNATVLTRLERATAHFDRFNLFIETLNSRLTETTELSKSLTQLMNRVNNFESIAQKIDSRVEESNRIIDSVNQHFDELERFEKRNAQMFLGMTDNMQDSHKVFENELKSSFRKVMNTIDEENEIIAKAYHEKKTKFDKLDLLENMDKLDNLELLKELSKLDVLFEMKEYIDAHVVQEKAGNDKVIALHKMLEELKRIIENREVRASASEKEVSNSQEILSTVKVIQGEIEKGNNRSVFRKIFGGN